ncbi:LPS translocon maturation chaperone LptM [Rhizobium sp. SL42]|uniref:LPS translocon maturation chaperone LptM n=1 Tax=Rhizobium sp. SL42 TaxID=2806346 RepID=UPI001F2D3F1E|nr:lipoprotein [Rhizobium sp. SL42]UJW75136.1 lipoprotein [Rhizobium sp. SL42]
MVKTLTRPTIAVSLLLAATLALSGCGRKGDLDPPSTPVDQQNKRDSKPQATSDTPFLLDPLL